MNDEQNSKTQLRAYLFGELEETVAEQLEEHFFTEPAGLEALQSVRDDLLDEWANGALSTVEAAQLEARFTKLPALRAHAEFARSLHQHFSEPIEAPVARQVAPLSWRAWFAQLFTWENRWQLAATATVGVTLGSWLVWNALHSRPTPSPNLAQQSSVTPAPSPDHRELEVTREKMKPALRHTPEPNLREPEVASFVLASAVLRGAAATAPDLELPAHAKTLRMELELPSDSFKPSRAALQNAAGETVWQQRSLRLHKVGATRYVVCEVAMALLAEGSYQWRIAPATGAEAAYPFTAKKSQAVK